MENSSFVDSLSEYKNLFHNILSRFKRTSDGIHIQMDDDPVYRQCVIELNDLFNDALGNNQYSNLIVNYYQDGISNFYQRPSYKSVENIIGVLGAAITRFKRNPQLLENRKTIEDTKQRQNIFIIHGKDEAKWRELKDILQNQFRLNPIVLQEQPDIGKTIIEKFENYAKTCSSAIAIFTPDDEVNSGGEIYLQARPNVIFELGWFCGRLDRSSVILLLKEGTTIFSDFGGIIQKRFNQNVSEKLIEIKNDLIAAGILDNV